MLYRIKTLSTTYLPKFVAEPLMTSVQASVKKGSYRRLSAKSETRTGEYQEFLLIFWLKWDPNEKRRVSGETAVNATNGPDTVFSRQEETEFAMYLSDLLQDIVRKENRKTPFTNDRPSYEWYKKFMNRNKDTVGLRKEILLEASRSQLTSNRIDKWFSGFRDFLAEKDLLDKPERIWNADETGFQMGSKPGYVIGPSRETFPTQVPHMSGSSTKSRLTVMFAASASGSIMPPFYVYPAPPPTGVNPLNCSLPGGFVDYTEKGWMNSQTFEQFLDHFEQHIVTEKPVVLLIDSVGSHINRTVFRKTLSKGIKLYRLVPNATHHMQPLDK
ncbi:hypothetical protein KUTeg_023513 [Tegillarca granosa]|uniref:DDE-1 domain-containing protein n=1 Tax=Tegillarca granosa TaxID=220873 RepID=A0ABQ9E1W5_TEGGR|nr:hypothetical protein KUTeg_023513 [Tegillarca granosa]